MPSLGDLARISLRHSWLGIIIGAGVIATVLWWARHIVPIYQASAALAMERRSKPVVFQVERESDSDQNFLNSQRDLLLSTSTLLRAINDAVFKSDPRYVLSADPVTFLRNRLTVIVPKDSSVVSVDFRDEDPVHATNGLQAVVNAFLGRQEEQRAQLTANALAFLEKQVKEAQQRVEDSRAKEREFRETHAIISVNPDDNYLAVRLKQLNFHHAELDTVINAGEALLTQVREANGATDPAARQQALLRIEAIGQDAGILSLEKDILALLDRQLTLDQRYLAKHPKIIEVREQLAVKRTQLAEAISATLATISLKQREKLDEAKALDAQIVSEERALKEFRDNLNALDLLGQATQSENRLYEQLLTRLNEERVTSQLQGSLLTVIDQPRASITPVNIKPFTTIIVAVLLGALAGFGAIMLLHACDRSVRGHAQIGDITGLPVLARVPFVENLTVIAPGGKHQQNAALAESFRSLRTSLKMIFPREPGCRCLVITSCQPGEGKTTVAVHLAVSLASTGARVLLVDADLRNPQVQRHFNDGSSLGLANLLAKDGKQGAAPRASGFANLSILPVGARPINPAELLHGQALPELIIAWRNAFDYLVFDTAPLGPVSDALVVGELADGVLMLVRDRVTLKADLRQIMTALSPLAERVIGAVINGDRGRAAKYGSPYMYAMANVTESLAPERSGS
jgi:capsular exopolysaccharide synthesis family protein